MTTEKLSEFNLTLASNLAVQVELEQHQYTDDDQIMEEFVSLGSINDKNGIRKTV